MRVTRPKLLAIGLFGICAVAFGLVLVQTPSETDTTPTPTQVKAPVSKNAVSAAPSTTIELPSVSNEANEPATNPATNFVDAATAERAQTARALTAVETVIDWESAQRHVRFDMNLLSPEQRERVTAVPIPVLLPQDAKLVQSAVVSVGDTWYTAAMNGGDYFVSITGSSRYLDIPGAGLENLPIYGDHQRGLSRSEGTLELDFTAYGVIYNVSIECDAYALQIADELALAATEES
jgi:hypothetical protein